MPRVLCQRDNYVLYHDVRGVHAQVVSAYLAPAGRGDKVVIVGPVFIYLAYLAQARITAANSHKSIYTFASDAIHINTDGKRMSVEWGTLLLAVWTRRALYLYVSPTKAFLLPRRQMQGHDEEILSYLKTFCPEKNRKISRGA